MCVCAMMCILKFLDGQELVPRNCFVGSYIFWNIKISKIYICGALKPHIDDKNLIICITL